MKVKIDTKEKFTVIAPITENLYANLTEELVQTIQSFLNINTKNIVLSLKEIQNIDEVAARQIAKLQRQFYESNASFVMCEMNDAIEEKFDKLELTDTLNIAPTESEAADIVQMEEIERELNNEEN